MDLLNNLSTLAEDTKALDASKLQLAARNYGKVATRKFFDQVLTDAA